MYFTLKPFLVFACVAAASAYFVTKAKVLSDLLLRVTKRGPARFDRTSERIGAVILDVLLQRRVRRKPLPGIAHSLIFWGFLGITIGTIEMIVNGIFSSVSLALLGSGVRHGYDFIADLLSLGVLVGVAMGLFRRLVLRPKYLRTGPDALFVLAITASLMISLILMNVFRVALSPAELRSVFPVSGALYTLLGLEGMGGEAARAGSELFYWTHLLLVLGFLCYIPNSKHLHILAAAPNIFFKQLARSTPIERTNLEDENATSFGLGKVSELSWKNTLDLYACTECGRCEEACPADTTGKPLSPARLIHDFKLELFRHKEKVLGGKTDEIPHPVREESGLTEDVLWSCTSCRACEEACPVYIEHTNLIFETRKSLVLMESRFPPELQTVFRNLENNFTPWAFGHDTRADWCRGLGVKEMADHPTAELLYYVGCAGSFDDRAKKVATAVVSLLKKAGVDFAILGKEEKCTGDPARRAGNEYLAQMLIQENVATLNRYKPRKILTACPHCFNMLKNEYPAFGAQYEVVHHTTYLAELIRAGKLRPTKNASTGEVTFHDSCYLGRWNDIYSDPREILNSIPELRIVEMERSGSKGLCCGAGGARMFMEETIGKRINEERTEEALGTGAKTIAAACPFCSTMITDGVKAKEKQDSVQVKDVAELLDATT